MYKITNSTKVRAFHYRILTNSLTTNKTLKRFRIIDSDLCYYCEKEVETSMHLLRECDKIQELWHWLEERCKAKLTSMQRIFSQTILDPRNALNFIRLLLKNYIYMSQGV